MPSWTCYNLSPIDDSEVVYVGKVKTNVFGYSMNEPSAKICIAGVGTSLVLGLAAKDTVSLTGRFEACGRPNPIRLNDLFATWRAGVLMMRLLSEGFELNKPKLTAVEIQMLVNMCKRSHQDYPEYKQRLPRAVISHMGRSRLNLSEHELRSTAPEIITEAGSQEMEGLFELQPPDLVGATAKLTSLNVPLSMKTVGQERALIGPEQLQEFMNAAITQELWTPSVPQTEKVPAPAQYGLPLSYVLPLDFDRS